MIVPWTVFDGGPGQDYSPVVQLRLQGVLLSRLMVTGFALWLNCPMPWLGRNLASVIHEMEDAAMLRYGCGR